MNGSNWKEELDSFLLNYRSTPHSTTSLSPFEVFFGRSVRNRIPGIMSYSKKNINDKIRTRDHQNKMKIKSYADKHRGNHKEFETGEHVLIKNEKKGKLQPEYRPETYVVEK